MIRPVIFAAARGDVIGLSGANGSGKSTLLKALIRAARIHAGRLDKRPRLRISPQQQDFDTLEGFPLSGAELLALAGTSADGLPPSLSTRLGERLGRLSGGQVKFLRVRACLMAAADVVLLDELPTTSIAMAPPFWWRRWPATARTASSSWSATMPPSCKPYVLK